MNEKKQSKTLGPRGSDAQAFEMVIGAIEECRAKPAYDYQRIIICHTKRPSLGPKLARRCGAKRVGPARPLDSKCASAVVVVEWAEDCGVELLESIVFFVNRTRGVVVLVAGDLTFTRRHDSWQSLTAHIRRRTHLTIEFDA